MSDQNSFEDNPSAGSQAGDTSKTASSRSEKSRNERSRNERSRNESTRNRETSREGTFSQAAGSLTQAGDRLLEAARRNPEALVILAAGAAMLLRRGNVYGGGASADRGRGSRRQGGEDDRDERGGIIDAAGAAGEYVTDAAGRIVDTAGEYVSTLSDYADDSRRTVTQGISRLSRSASRIGSRAQASAERIFEAQPVAVAAFGLATGAVVAAVLPRSEVEQRTLVPAREALADAASRAVETVKETAERRFSADGLRDLAGDAAKIVTQTVLGKAGEGRDSDDRA
jgi:hypothetical protein